MIGWKSTANFFPCTERKSGRLVKSGTNDLQCGTGKKEDIPARLTQLQVGGLDAGLGEDKIIVSLNAAIEYVASIMMRKSTDGAREPHTYDGASRWKFWKEKLGSDLAKKSQERWKNFVDCDGGFWEELGRNDYENTKYVSWGVADEVVFSNVAPGSEEGDAGPLIIVGLPDDELMYGGTICGTTARTTRCFQVRRVCVMRGEEEV